MAREVLIKNTDRLFQSISIYCLKAVAYFVIGTCDCTKRYFDIFLSTPKDILIHHIRRDTIFFSYG